MVDELQKRKVILVTDGDLVAKHTVEEATRRIGGRCISASAGNPTPLTGREIIELIRCAKNDPVVVMVDDRGSCHEGKGEKALKYVATHPEVEVLGVLAVASNTRAIEGAEVDYSVTKGNQIVKGEVDKYGNLVSGENRVYGDTVDVLNKLGREVPIVVGIGDIGKMDGYDDPENGAQITTKALEIILQNDKNSH